MVEKFMADVEVNKILKEIVKKEKYRCSDGKEFDNITPAKDWEETLAIFEKIKHVPSRIVGGINFGVIGTVKSGKAWYITSQEEFDTVCVYQNRTDGYLFSMNESSSSGEWKSEKFEEPDWYVFFWNETDYDVDYYWIERYSNHVKAMQEYMSKFL